MTVLVAVGWPTTYPVTVAVPAWLAMACATVRLTAAPAETAQVGRPTTRVRTNAIVSRPGHSQAARLVFMPTDVSESRSRMEWPLR